MTGHAEESAHARRAAVTPPTEEPDRPGVVTAAVVVWFVLGVLMIGTALLFGVSLVTGTSETGPGPLLVVLIMVLLAAGGVAVVLAARRVGAGSRLARRGLTITGVVLAAIGLVQVTFLGVGGVWFVAFVAGAALLHLPAARRWFRLDRA